MMNLYDYFYKEKTLPFGESIYRNESEFKFFSDVGTTTKIYRLNCKYNFITEINLNLVIKLNKKFFENNLEFKLNEYKLKDGTNLEDYFNEPYLPLGSLLIKDDGTKFLISKNELNNKLSVFNSNKNTITEYECIIRNKITEKHLKIFLWGKDLKNYYYADNIDDITFKEV